MKVISFFRSIFPTKAVVSGGFMASVAYTATSILHQYAHVDVPADVMATVFGSIAGFAYHIIPAVVQTKLDAFDAVVRAAGPAVVDMVAAPTAPVAPAVA